MSATPPARAPNGGPPMIIRPSVTSDPLVRPKKRPQRPLLRKPQPSAARPNPNAPTSGHSLENKPGSTSTPASETPPATKATTTKSENNGFSGPPPKGEYYDYDLVTTKRALMEGLRYHIARFASKKDIDPTKAEDFTRPVRLQRRDPRAPPAGGIGSKGATPAVAAPETKEELLDEKERERQEILRAEKEAQKLADLEQIAPRTSQPTATAKKPTTFNKKTTQVYDHDQTPEARKRSQVRYEEALPWHLEDFDNKNAWVGNYESALSDMYVGLIGSPNKFHVVPMERWYKFTPKNHFKTLTIEEAESRMNKAMKEPRWIMEQRNALSQQKQQQAENRRGGRRLFLGKWDDQKGGRPSARSKADPDADDIDFDQVVSDDEGPQLMEGEEEEAKEAENRIKKDQLQANIFDLKEEKEYEREDAEDKKQAELAKKLGKGVKKALIDREKNYIYDSDSSANPYSDESESEKSDDDKEKSKEDEKKKADEKPEKPKGKETSKAPSGASSKGTNTPSGRTKHSDPLKKYAATLKRPGSPDLSEASGTETAVKKQKKKHAPSSQNPTAPTSRQMSPSGEPERKPTLIKLSVNPTKLSEISSSAPNPQKKRIREKMGGAGSGSDGEATGGEQSENGRKKIKLRVTSPNANTPRGSRAGSPNVTTGVVSGAGRGGGSRAGSPTAGSPPPAELTPVTDAEIIANIPPEGTTIPALVRALGRNRVGIGKDSFATMVKRHAIFGPNKVLKPKPRGSDEGSELAT